MYFFLDKISDQLVDEMHNFPGDIKFGEITFQDKTVVRHPAWVAD